MSRPVDRTLAEAIGDLLDGIAYDDPGVVAIGIERARCLDKTDRTVEHDVAEHAHGELVDAAMCYLVGHGADKHRPPYEQVPTRWPWDAQDFHPGDTGNEDSDRLRDLRRAGQLIAAEITRLSETSARLPLGELGTHG